MGIAEISGAAASEVVMYRYRCQEMGSASTLRVVASSRARGFCNLHLASQHEEPHHQRASARQSSCIAPKHHLQVSGSSRGLNWSKTSSLQPLATHRWRISRAHVDARAHPMDRSLAPTAVRGETTYGAFRKARSTQRSQADRETYERELPFGCTAAGSGPMDPRHIS